jgi:predicted transcriptional regulator
VTLDWKEITRPEAFLPDDDFTELNDIDFMILNHHRQYGPDYSHKVAAMLNLDRRAVFDCHSRLRELGLLERVEPRMIQYRKNIVKGKWIKHRNHTYYDLTDKGKRYLDFYLSGRS